MHKHKLKFLTVETSFSFLGSSTIKRRIITKTIQIEAHQRKNQNSNHIYKLTIVTMINETTHHTLSDTFWKCTVPLYWNTLFRHRQVRQINARSAKESRNSCLRFQRRWSSINDKDWKSSKLQNYQLQLLKIKIKSKTMIRNLKTPQQILDKNPKFSFTFFLFSSSTQPNRKFK